MTLNFKTFPTVDGKEVKKGDLLVSQSRCPLKVLKVKKDCFDVENLLTGEKSTKSMYCPCGGELLDTAWYAMTPEQWAIIHSEYDPKEVERQHEAFIAALTGALDKIESVRQGIKRLEGCRKVTVPQICF